MTVLGEDNDTFLMFHKYAWPSLDNRSTTLFDHELIKVHHFYLLDTSFYTSEMQAFWLLGTNILSFLFVA